MFTAVNAALMVVYAASNVLDWILVISVAGIPIMIALVVLQMIWKLVMTPFMIGHIVCWCLGSVCAVRASTKSGRGCFGPSVIPRVWALDAHVACALHFWGGMAIALSSVILIVAFVIPVGGFVADSVGIVIALFGYALDVVGIAIVCLFGGAVDRPRGYERADDEMPADRPLDAMVQTPLGSVPHFLEPLPDALEPIPVQASGTEQSNRVHASHETSGTAAGPASPSSVAQTASVIDLSVAYGVPSAALALYPDLGSLPASPSGNAIGSP